ncbi:CheY-P phosphatase CheC [bioreactor metagenome]|uniref:CheY-P phosphatase CheC n=1 Tax=bioreactor metagenome TaxID=1076179 RepID=A0A645G3M0_9ZZZZ
MSVSHASFCGLKDIWGISHGPETIVAAVLVELSGDIKGHLLMLQEVQDAQRLAESAIHAAEIEDEQAAEFPSEMQYSAALEIANILCGAYVTAIRDLTGFSIQCSPPSMAIDMCGAVMNLLACRYGEISDVVLLLEAEFRDELHHVSGRIFLLSDPGSYRRLLERMGLI